MRVRSLFLILATAGCATGLPERTAPSAAPGQSVQATVERAAAAKQAEADVLAVVNRLWDAMRTNDSTMARSVFDSSAKTVRIIDRNGARVVRWDSPNGFITAIGNAKTPWIERMVNPEVRIDQNLASVWTWYDFTVNGAVSHCGYDSIELVRFPEGWKIIYLADTRQTTGCEAPRVPR